MNTLPSRSQRSEKERAALSRLRQILIDPTLLHATCIRHKRVCGKSYCRCAKSKEARHASWYVAQTIGRKTRMRYIPQRHYKEVRHWVSQYGEIRRLLNKLSDCSWERIKGMSKK